MLTERIPDRIKELINKGEGIDIEFKTAQFELNRNTFDSICAFLNRNGGDLILGVADNGEIKGILDNSVQSIIDNLTTNANNPQKLNPTFYLSPKVYEDEKQNKIIHVFIPESSQVHSTNGRIFDRNEDGDFDVTGNNDHIGQLYFRKKATYTENKIYSHVTIDCFKDELFQRVRALAKSERADHPWLELTNEELLKSAGLYRKDYQTGEVGYTLAAIFIFGQDDVIHNIFPYYKTDALLRQVNINRYDDRDEIRTNLIESYDRLMAFVRKHLPDKFYQENDQRVNIRDRIFREIVGNILIHREYINSYPAKFIIEEGRTITENWNRPHGTGNIDPSYFSPYPKNPVIAKFFKEIGRADELGSGVRNTFRYCKLFVKDANPKFIEGDVFTSIIPIPSAIRTIEIKETVEETVEGAVEGAVKGAVEGATEGVIEKLSGLTLAIIEKPGNRVPYYAQQTDISPKTLEGYIKRLITQILDCFSIQAISIENSTFPNAEI